MSAYAEKYFALNATDKDGVSYRETLEGLLERQGGRKSHYEAELAMPPMPIAIMYLWTAYHRIRNRKGGNGFSASPIEWPDIDAFVRNSRMVLRPWEIEVIEMLDNFYMADQARQARAQATEE